MEKLGQVNVDSTQRKVLSISQDCFYRELTPSEIQKAEKGQFNFDHPDAFNEKLMEDALIDILAGKIVQIPTYDYKNHSVYVGPYINNVLNVDINFVGEKMKF